MKNVLIPLAPGFEEIETINVIDILRRFGAQVSIAGIIEGIIEGSRGVKFVTMSIITILIRRNLN